MPLFFFVIIAACIFTIIFTSFSPGAQYRRTVKKMNFTVMNDEDKKNKREQQKTKG